MEQIHEHVIRRPGKVVAHQRNSSHDFGEFVHGHTDEIDLARNGPVVWVVGVTESAAERKSAIVRKIIRAHPQGLGFSRGEHVNVRSANGITRRKRTART
jgi:hypothetical protein